MFKKIQSEDQKFVLKTMGVVREALAVTAADTVKDGSDWKGVHAAACMIFQLMLNSYADQLKLMLALMEGLDIEVSPELAALLHAQGITSVAASTLLKAHLEAQAEQVEHPVNDAKLYYDRVLRVAKESDQHVQTAELGGDA